MEESLFYLKDTGLEEEVADGEGRDQNCHLRLSSDHQEEMANNV